MTTDDAEGALLELASSLVDEVAAARLVLTGHSPAPPRELTPRQLGLAGAANPDLPATPDRPGHEDRRRHCDYCGGTRGELVPGPDGEDGYRVCADERGCLARHEHRYPARPDLVPDAVLSAVGLADQQLLPREPAAAQPAPQQEPQEGWWQPQGWQVSQYGAYDVNGQWHPALPRFQPPNARPVSGWAHTLRHPANRTHLLENDRFMRELYGRGVAAVAPAEHADHDAGAGPAPAESIEALNQRGLYEAAGGATAAGSDVPLQQPAEPEAAPQRPARQQRPRDRYGRRRPLRYTGRR